MPIHVAIVEDNVGICEQLRHILSRTPDLACVCVCRNSRTALELLPASGADVVLMDVQLPDGTGIDCLARLKPRMAPAQFLMFTIHAETDLIIRALSAGAIGYLLKDSAPDEIVAAIREAKTGGAPMTPTVARKLVENFQAPAGGSEETVQQLTRREHAVLDLLSHGLIDKEIADQLSISLQTVNSHLKHIYSKLRVHSRTEAAFKYFGPARRALAPAFRHG